MRLESGFWYAEQLLLFPLNTNLLPVPAGRPCTSAAAKPRCVGSAPWRARAAAACPARWSEPALHSHAAEPSAVCAACQPFVCSLQCSRFPSRRKKCSWACSWSPLLSQLAAGACPPQGDRSDNPPPSHSLTSKPCAGRYLEPDESYG